MQKAIILQPQPRAWLEGSILRPYISQYGEHLQRRRYAPNTQRAYLCCLAHFAHWLTQEGYILEAIGQGAVMRFLSEHLPACACPDPVRRLRHELQAALGHLLEVLEAGGVVLQYPARNSAIERELTRFDAHMRDVWGLADNTRRKRCRVIGGFLVVHFGANRSTWRQSTPHPSAASSLANMGDDPPPWPLTASSLAAICASAACPATG